MQKLQYYWRNWLDMPTGVAQHVSAYTNWVGLLSLRSHHLALINPDFVRCGSAFRSYNWSVLQASGTDNLFQWFQTYKTRQWSNHSC